MKIKLKNIVNSKHTLNYKTRFFFTLLFSLLFISFKFQETPVDEEITYFTVDPSSQKIQLYWKNDEGETIGNFQKLKSFVEAKQEHLLFAMNGGMYKKDNSPVGLYIEKNKTLSPLDTMKGNGNFYLQPNGVFYITNENKAVVCKTSDFKPGKKIKYATQSGPLLLIDGEIHPAFKKESGNMNIRNAVGILPDNRVIFAISKTEINFYNFAMYFKKRGCKNALYLDGYVSRIYLPGKNPVSAGENFGVMIGVTREKGN